MHKVEKLLNSLEKLPPRKIAEKISRSGVKGRVGSPFSCVLAKYIRHETGWKTSVDAWHTSPLRGKTYVEHGRNLRTFIIRFDLNQYPELVED